MVGLFTSSAAILSLGDKLVNWYEKSLIKELLDYFSERYFSVDLGSYENFSITPALGGTLRNIILALAAAIILAACLTAHTRVNIGAFVRRLIKEGCLSAERAKTLFELGYFRSTTIRRELSRGGALGMVVHRLDAADAAEQSDDASEKEIIHTDDAQDTNANAEQVTDACDSAENGAQNSAVEDTKNAHVVGKNATRMRGNAEKIDFMTAKFYIPEELRDRAEIRFNPKGSSWRSAIVVSVLAIVAASVLCLFTPELLQLADNIMTWLAP